MIEIKYFERNNRYAISLKGHADYAPHGQDIVCASVSSLVTALGNYILEHFAEQKWIVLEVNLDTGDSNVEILDESGNDVAKNLYHLVYEQLQDIAELYPINLKIFEN